MPDSLVLVDMHDREMGVADKTEAHVRPLLHRAFSLFLYSREGGSPRFLLQQRSLNKYHSGGLWANTCCSHPRPGEGLLAAAARRLGEEMGITCPLEEIGSFVYYHQFSPVLYEYEFDHVLTGCYGGECRPNPLEVAGIAWVEASRLAEDLRSNPRRYAPWFPIAAGMVLERFRGFAIKRSLGCVHSGA
jgi:isopentenyl-diphosphate delta-isomerase